MTNRVSIWRSDWDPATAAESHPPVDDRLPRLNGDEAQRLAGFLDAGVLVLSTTMMLPDPLSESDAPCVRINQRTDGLWAWDDAVAYFVRTYSISPPLEFLEYARSRNFESRHPTQAEFAQVRAELGLG